MGYGLAGLKGRFSTVMDTFVIPDIHGEYDALRRLLEAAGIVDEERRIRDDVNVIQLGDLANCVDESELSDMKCLDTVGDWIDLMLCGNHEHPYFGGPPFSGFRFKWPVFFKLADLAKVGKITCSAEVDGWLITHAGLGQMHNRSWETAKAANGKIRALWVDDPTDHLFSDIGYSRGGMFLEGGILWHDVKEPTFSGFSQLFGHSVGKEIVRPSHGKWCCIDVGMGKHSDLLVGAWIKSGQLEIFAVAK